MKKLFLTTTIALVLLFTGTCFASGILVIKNCNPNTWVGGVRWLNNKTDYEDVPELELKGEGVITIELEAGEYAITYYRPAIQNEYGFWPAAILDFKDNVVIKDNWETHILFGCEQ